MFVEHLIMESFGFLILLLMQIGQSHPTGLTANLLKLFEPRPPLEYKPPPEKRKCPPLTGFNYFSKLAYHLLIFYALFKIYFYFYISLFSWWDIILSHFVLKGWPSL